MDCKMVQHNSTHHAIHNDSWGFLKLPGEIRNTIYDYALVDTEQCVRFTKSQTTRHRCQVERVVCRSARPACLLDSTGQPLGRFEYPNCNIPRARDLEHTVFSVAMLQTCKQINVEAAPIFYGKNLFSFQGQADFQSFLNHFETRIPLLRRLALRVVGTLFFGFYEAELYMNNLALIFVALQQATSLEALFVDRNFHWSYIRKPKIGGR